MVLTGQLALSTIQAMRGAVDVYYANGIVNARAWPSPSTQPPTQEQIAARQLFRNMHAFINRQPEPYHIAWKLQPPPLFRTYVDNKRAAAYRQAQLPVVRDYIELIKIEADGPIGGPISSLLVYPTHPFPQPILYPQFTCRFYTEPQDRSHTNGYWTVDPWGYYYGPEVCNRQDGYIPAYHVITTGAQYPLQVVPPTSGKHFWDIRFSHPWQDVSITLNQLLGPAEYEPIAPFLFPTHHL